MRLDLVKKTIGAALAIMMFGFAPLSAAQDKPADNMQILRDKIKADKKLVVATNMELTESEAKGFWPIYESYQKDLQKINRRLANRLERSAPYSHGKSLPHDKSQTLINEGVGIEHAVVN